MLMQDANPPRDASVVSAREARRCGVDFVLFEPTGVVKTARAVRGGNSEVLRYVTHAFLNMEELFAMAAVDGDPCAHSGRVSICYSAVN